MAYTGIGQTGPISDNCLLLMALSLLFIFIIVLYFTLHTQKPYVMTVDYIYKPNYYKKFMLPEGYDVDTQGRKWSNWDTDEKGIQQICNLFNESMGYFNTTKNKASDLGISLLEDWIVAFLTELEKTPVIDPSFQGFPWGSNWYQFTISAPTTMAYYIVNKRSKGGVKKSAAAAIQYLIIDPQHSLGYTRDKANSAMMLFPWTLSHLITGTLDRENEAYQYAISQYDLKPNPNIRVNEDGVHIDYAYLIHNGVYAYGYFESIYAIYPDTKQILPEVSQFDLDYHHDMWTAKLYHPTIPVSGSTLFHRRQEIGCATYKGKQNLPSVVTIPSMKYLRIFGKDFQWSARLGGISIVYYECDQSVYNMGLYSCLCKERFTAETTKEAKFPVSGFLYPKGQTTLTEVDPNPDNLTHPTTYGYYGSNFTVYAHSFTLVDYDEGIAFFKVMHITYKPLLDTHIDESGYYDFKTNILKYWLVLEIEDYPTYRFWWGGEEIDLTKIDLEGKAVLEATINMKTGETWYGASEINDTYTAELYEINPKYVTTSNQNSHYPTASDDPKDSFTIIWKDDKPFMYVPGETEIHCEKKSLTYSGNDMSFTFDKEWNQYIADDYVKQNTYINYQI